MTLYFENEYTTRPLEECFPFDAAAAAREVIEAVLQESACPYEAEASLTLTDDEGIREMNRQFREIDRATDVLSFPVTAYSIPGNYEEAEEEAAGSFNPESGALLLGDIVISVDHTLQQAEEYGHSVRREYCFLVAHSALHLIGYDHMSEEEERTMCDLQEKILLKLGISRQSDDGK